MIFSSGDPIAHMAAMVGYGTFLVEHVMFGLAAALVLVPFTPAPERLGDYVERVGAYVQSSPRPARLPTPE